MVVKHEKCGFANKKKFLVVSHIRVLLELNRITIILKFLKQKKNAGILSLQFLICNTCVARVGDVELNYKTEIANDNLFFMC